MRLVGQTKAGAVVIVAKMEEVVDILAGSPAPKVEIGSLPFVHAFEDETCDPVELSP